MSSEFQDAPRSTIDTTIPSDRGDKARDRNRQSWQTLIDYPLIEWGWNTDLFDEEGIEGPSRDIVQKAIQLAARFRDGGLVAPDTVVSDGNGGIVFELREGHLSEVFHIWDDGGIEYRRFEGTRLVERRTLH